MAVEAGALPESGPVRLPRRFWAFWGAGAVSWLGDGVLIVGFPLLAASMTHSPFWIAAVAFMQRLPAWFLAIPIGALIDRRDARRTAVVMNLAQAVLLGLTALWIGLGHFPLIALMAAAFATESLATAFKCANGKMIADLVPPELFGLANGRLRAAETTIAYVAGPGLGGLLFTAGHQWPMLLDAVSFAGAALVLAAMRLDSPKKKPSSAGERHFVREIKDGLRIVFGEPAVRLMAMTIGVLAGFQAGSAAMLVLLGTDDLGLSRTAFGVTVGLGNVVAPVLILFLPKVANLRPSTTVFGAIAVAAVGEVLLGTATTPAQMAAGLALDGSAVTVGSVAMLTARMRLVPREMLGRMSGAFLTIINGSITLGTLLGGAAARINLRAPYLLCGAACLVLLVVVGPKLHLLDPTPSASVPPQADAADALTPREKPEPADRS